ncbi:glucose 1-dehydrogenase [Pyxidicoccus parkwayensis]|uniref:Glucose 1-dehydrogenase n=1 Tax=Pyxidicoccus parkwayensis TaxID=2813578 RepID=A0ABX7P1V4_9BACT|nr:glucose 1-dehydrogenase [Pyxidicoccus parkwaysis]QSQ24130.1 glucose 1-dehydrogenase [Pyxidicoccus parkwaysis]
MRGIEGRVAVVTGGSSGIGLATAKLLCAEGAKVLIASRGEARGLAAERELRDAGGEALFVQTDVTRADEVRRMVDAALQRWGRLDLAVNNAAIGDITYAPTAELSEEEFDRTLAVCLKGVWLCLKYQLPVMMNGGAVVNVSSTTGLAGKPLGSFYCAAKHGVHGLTQSAALEYAAQRVRLNVLCPGPHRTPMLEGVFKKVSPGAPEKAAKYMSSRVPLGRIGDPEESARAIVWLLSDEASYVTGAVLAVDGGITAGAA